MTASAPTIALLHGFGESAEVWANFTPDFPDHYRVLTPDLLGHGDNTHHISDYSMEAQADYVAAFLRRQHVEKALLVGHSMGGYVALAAAERHPALVAGLCLFHSTALPDTEEKRANRDKNIDFIERHGVAKFMESFVRPLFAPANRDTLMAEREMLEEIGKATPTATVVGALRAMQQRPDRTHVLRAATFPVQFIVGQDDVAVPPDSVLPQLPLPRQSHSLMLADVGHLGYLEQPDVTRRAVLAFAGAVFG